MQDGPGPGSGAGVSEAAGIQRADLGPMREGRKGGAESGDASGLSSAALATATSARPE